MYCTCTSALWSLELATENDFFAYYFSGEESRPSGMPTAYKPGLQRADILEEHVRDRYADRNEFGIIARSGVKSSRPKCRLKLRFFCLFFSFYKDSFPPSVLDREIE